MPRARARAVRASGNRRPTAPLVAGVRGTAFLAGSPYVPFQLERTSADVEHVREVGIDWAIAGHLQRYGAVPL